MNGITMDAKGFGRAHVAAGLLALATLACGAACSKSERYTYVDVHIGVDPLTISPNQLSMVIQCEFRVLGAEMSDAISLVRGCPENNLAYDVGTLSWTSNATSGALQFQVQLFGVNRVVIGEATSDPVPVAPGTHPKISMLVEGVLPAAGPDGGATDATTPTDGGMDTSSDGASQADASSDSPGAADGGPVTDGATSTDSATTDASTDAGMGDATDGSGGAG